jgi:hypothetical protein
MNKRAQHEPEIEIVTGDTNSTVARTKCAFRRHGEGMSLSERNEKIEAAVCDAGGLIQALLELGELSKGQAELLIKAAVRAKVPNASDYEIAMAVRHVVIDLEHAGCR